MSRKASRAWLVHASAQAQLLARARLRAVLANRTTTRPSIAAAIRLVEQAEQLLPGAVRRWLSRRLGHSGRTLSSIISRPNGHIDAWADGVIHGWAWTPLRPEQRLTLIVTAGGVPVTTTIADLERRDVREAGCGDGRYGFRIPVAIDEVVKIAGPDIDRLDVLALDSLGIPRWIGEVPLLENFRFETLIDRLPPEFVARHITPWAAIMMQAGGEEGRDDVGELSRFGESPSYRRLFTSRTESPQFQSADAFQARPTISAYVRYTAARHHKDVDYPIERTPQAADGLLRWYLDYYTQVRAEHRAPLSPSEIAYLNASVNPISVGGARPLSRVALSYYLEDDTLRSKLSPMLAKDYREFAYWWAVEKAPSLHVEDCLVPDYYVDVLRAPATIEPPPGLPLPAFVELYVGRTEGMRGLNLRTVDGTLGVYLHLLLRATQRPDLLRYVPNPILALFFDKGDASDCPFDTLVDAASEHVRPGLDPGARQSRDLKPSIHLQRRLDAQGYDVGRGSFNSVDTEGYRAHAARLTKPAATDPVVDIQVIGPFAKASGLGQACRLAGEIVRKTAYSSNFVDFGLDNPTPEGFSTKVEVGKLKRSRINLIHLNAEALPLAFAYLPDVFSDSYNIGFFYWELDTPAACHRLGMELVDEIWVASDYGVSQYQPHSLAPVTNVGVAVEAVPDIDRRDARARLRARFGIRDGTFVFMATFDSYSYATRKNPVGTVRAFQAAFSDGSDDVMLILKTQNRRRIADMTQVSELDALYEAAAVDPRIKIVDETLDYRDLILMKKGADAYVSLHRSEGWGFGPIEAMALGVPVIATAYSGNMEFCNDDTAWLVDYELVAVPEKDYIFVVPGQKWANPSLEDASAKMRSCFENEALRASRALTALEFVEANFSVSAIAQRWQKRLTAILEARDGG